MSRSSKNAIINTIVFLGFFVLLLRCGVYVAAILAIYVTARIMMSRS
jgi:hypothetical protein